MRIGVVLVGIVSFVASVYGVVWLVNNSQVAVSSLGSAGAAANGEGDKAADPSAKWAPTNPDVKGRPKINTSADAPQPKAVIDETEFDFDRMELGETRTHAFVIRNEGNATLEVVAGPTTCQCTVGSVGKNKVEPGESTEVTLEWKPTAPTEEFLKGADIWTNDPNNETIKLGLRGIVATRLVLYPSGVWAIPEMREDTPSEITATISSAIEKEFAITGFDCPSEFVSAEALKIEDEKALDSLDALSGYKIHVKVRPEVNVGAFSIPFTIKTDLIAKSGAPIEIPVTIRGSRRGPIRILGTEWVSEFGAISMGAFDAAAGRSVTLKVVVLQPPADGLKVDEAGIVCDPKELRVRLVPDESAKPTTAAARFLLTVEYPPGSPRLSRRNENPGSIKIPTNHPSAGNMEFAVHFAAH